MVNTLVGNILYAKEATCSKSTPFVKDILLNLQNTTQVWYA